MLHHSRESVSNRMIIHINACRTSYVFGQVVVFYNQYHSHRQTAADYFQVQARFSLFLHLDSNAGRRSSAWESCCIHVHTQNYQN